MKTMEKTIKHKDVILNTTLYQFLKKRGIIRKFKTNCIKADVRSANSIIRAFRWNDTPEGLDYWAEISNDFDKYIKNHDEGN